MKIVFGLVALVLIGGLAFIFWTPGGDLQTRTEPMVVENEMIEEVTPETRTFVANGQYEVSTEESTVRWAGQKPLIEGYVNTGSMVLKSGSIEVTGEEVTGKFTIDMQTLSVSETPAKPGKENALEGHLKGERWFNVETFPEASFVITNVSPQADSETSFMFEVTGDLTMKGETHELMFPALIYTQGERTYASAQFEFDRTLWGITSGSGSFFDDLADNVVDDMVALSFELVSEAK